MSVRTGRRWLPIIVVCLLLAGIFAPVEALGQASPSSQQQGQLALLVSVAESSRTYAHGAVDYAASSGLSVGSAQARLAQGDSLLSTAQADLQAGANLAAGIESAQAAMSDYSAAAATASLALSNAGLTASVDYDAAVSAVAEVNATVNVVASVAAQACASGSTAQAFAQACAQVSAQVSAARLDLAQASSLLVRSDGQVVASADVSQALSLVAKARAQVEASQSELLTIASYTYVLRGQAYVASVVNPLSAGANATIKAEGSAVTNLTDYQMSWTAYAHAQASAVTSVSSAASALGTAISQVDTGAVATSISSAQSTAGQVNTEMSALLAITALAAFPSVIADIDACVSATSSYESALASASTWSNAYSQTSVSGFGSYLSTGTSDSAAVQSAGSAYVSAYNKVVQDLSGLLTVPGVQAIYNILVGLPVSSTVSGADSALSQETSAMATVQSGISSLSTAVASSGPDIIVSNTLLDDAAASSAQGTIYLNATAAAALAQVSAYAQATAQAAQAYVASAQACLQTTIGGYADSAASLASSGTALDTQTQASVSVTGSAVAYISSDLRLRSSEAATGRADVAQALQFLSSQNVSAGVAAIAQACLEFRMASAVSA